MRKRVVRAFPLEAPFRPWPLLMPTPEDKQYLPVPELEIARQRRLRRESRVLLYLDLFAAIPKGAVLGLLAFGLVATITWNLPFWLQGWHWAFGLGGAVVLSILIGPDLVLILLAAGIVILTIISGITHPFLLLQLLSFVLGGVIVRSLFELMPYKTS